MKRTTLTYLKLGNEYGWIAHRNVRHTRLHPTRSAARKAWKQGERIMAIPCSMLKEWHTAR